MSLRQVPVIPVAVACAAASWLLGLGLFGVVVVFAVVGFGLDRLRGRGRPDHDLIDPEADAILAVQFPQYVADGGRFELGVERRERRGRAALKVAAALASTVLLFVMVFVLAPMLSDSTRIWVFVIAFFVLGAMAEPFFRDAERPPTGLWTRRPRE